MLLLRLNLEFKLPYVFLASINFGHNQQSIDVFSSKINNELFARLKYFDKVQLYNQKFLQEQIYNKNKIGTSLFDDL